jgi:N,N'-diacetyllegionaminate synthase
MSVIHVGGKAIGPGQPCFIAAEVGINHNGDMELAHKLIDAAADAGADAVKFQNYHTEDFISDPGLTYAYSTSGETVTESQRDLFLRYELAPGVLRELREHCDRRGVVFFSTPTGEQSLSELVAAGASLLKNGSDYLVHLPLIRAMARTGLPTVLSTGMSTLAEIDDAVRTFRDAGGTECILLHCTSQYPTPSEDVNLRKIPGLRAVFGCPVGFSDHTCGYVAAIGSVVLGGCFIEKHFTLDHTLVGPDHTFSTDPAEFREMVQAVRVIEANLGTSAIGPTPTEQVNRREWRLSCVAAHELAAGHRLESGDIAYKRPGSGLPPVAERWLIGRRLARDLKPGTPFAPDDFD